MQPVKWDGLSVLDASRIEQVTYLLVGPLHGVLNLAREDICVKSASRICRGMRAYRLRRHAGLHRSVRCRSGVPAPCCLGHGSTPVRLGSADRR